MVERPMKLAPQQRQRQLCNPRRGSVFELHFQTFHHTSHLALNPCACLAFNEPCPFGLLQQRLRVRKQRHASQKSFQALHNFDASSGMEKQTAIQCDSLDHNTRARS